MAQFSRTQLLGNLTKDELLVVLPANTFTKTARHMTWSYILEVLQAEPNDVISIVRQAKEDKKAKLREKRAQKQQKKRHLLAARGRNEGGSALGGDRVDVEPNLQESVLGQENTFGGMSETGNDYAKYLELPTDAEAKNCFRAFRDATSNAALAIEVCIVCAREFAQSEGKDYKC